jgi:hypothetical protein
MDYSPLLLGCVVAAFLLIAVMAIRFAADTLLGSVTIALAELCDPGTNDEPHRNMRVRKPTTAEVMRAERDRLRAERRGERFPE